MTNFEFVVLGLLALGSLFVGFVSRDFFNGVGTSYFNNAVALTPPNILLEIEILPSLVKSLPFIGSTIAALAAVFLFLHLN